MSPFPSLRPLLVGAALASGLPASAHHPVYLTNRCGSDIAVCPFRDGSCTGEGVVRFRVREAPAEPERAMPPGPGSMLTDGLVLHSGETLELSLDREATKDFRTLFWLRQPEATAHRNWSFAYSVRVGTLFRRVAIWPVGFDPANRRGFHHVEDDIDLLVFTGLEEPCPPPEAGGPFPPSSER